MGISMFRSESSSWFTRVEEIRTSRKIEPRWGTGWGTYPKIRSPRFFLLGKFSHIIVFIPHGTTLWRNLHVSLRSTEREPFGGWKIYNRALISSADTRTWSRVTYLVDIGNAKSSYRIQIHVNIDSAVAQRHMIEYPGSLKYVTGKVLILLQDLDIQSELGSKKIRCWII